jgi:hypothetical protein
MQARQLAAKLREIKRIEEERLRQERAEQERLARQKAEEDELSIEESLKYVIFILCATFCQKLFRCVIAPANWGLS